MNGSKTEVGTGIDKLKLVVALMVLAAGVYGFYYWAAEPLVYRILVVLGAVAGAMLISSTTDVGRDAWNFIVSSRTEVRKVVWPSRTETTQTTLYVLIMVIIVGIFLWLLDMFLLWAARMLTGQGG